MYSQKPIQSGTIDAAILSGLSAEAPEERVRALERLESLIKSERMSGEEAIPYLLHALRDDEKEIRNTATLLLGLIGEDALSELSRFLNDSSWVVRYRVCEALSLMKVPAAYPHLQTALSDGKDHVRYMAAKGLGLLGISSAVSDLTVLLNDENPYVRAMAQNAIDSISGTPTS